MIERICKILGKSETDLFSQQLDDLNSVSPEMLSDLRQLEITAFQLMYLRQLTSKEDARYIPFFLEEVLRDEIPPNEWQSGAILTPNFSFQQMLELSTEELLAEVGMDFTLRTKPIREYWELNIRVGVPAKKDFTTTYRTVFPSNLTTYALDYQHVESVEHMDNCVVVRRWIAQLIARIQNHYGLLNDLSNLSRLEETLEYSDWSVDAQKALQGLILEGGNNSWSENEVPGMTGNDDWYL
ncbi:MAG: hypothetical protein AB8B56_10945 [Crocinitomicaceae bacterium]